MKTALIILLALALIGSLTGNYLEYSRYSSQRPVIRVGDTVITRKDYQDQIDHQYGKTVLNKMVYAALIHNAAVKAGVAPTDKDIDSRIAEIERRNPQTLEAAKRDPTLMSDLRDNLAQDIGFENLRIQGVDATDAELRDFYAKNKDEFAVPTQAQTTVVVCGNDIDAATAKGLLEQGMTGEAIARQPRLRVAGVGGYALPTDLPVSLRQQINATVFRLKPGQIGSIPVGSGFLIIRVNSVKMSGTPDFATVKPLLTRLYKLRKGTAPDVELAKLYRDGHVSFEMDKYAPYFTDIQGAVDRLNSTKSAASGAAAK